MQNEQEKQILLRKTGAGKKNTKRFYCSVIQTTKWVDRMVKAFGPYTFSNNYPIT